MESMTVKSGSILLYSLYDVAWESDLRLVEQKAHGARRFKIDRKRFSKAFEFTNPPVTVSLGTFQKELLGARREVRSYGKVYDYGAMTIILELPVADMPYSEYEALARHIRDTSPFGADFQREKEGIYDVVKEALKGNGAEGIEEDYAVYFIRSTDPLLSAREFLDACDLGGILLHEEGEAPPGEAVLKDLLSYTFSYSEGDLAVVNWDNALVLEPTGSVDIPDLLEFANAQLLELRVYDHLLDRELDNIYTGISARTPASLWNVRRYGELATRVMRIVTELTDITEKVDNAVKVTEDVYYARIYSKALELFKVKAWELSIRRKLDIASRVYTMLYQEIQNRRLEVLELVIVILIAVEIVLFLFMDF
jgi:hypothetical protein